MTARNVTGGCVDSLTSDGRIVRIRRLDADDLAAVRDLHDRASDTAIYLRYFVMNRESAQTYAATMVATDPRRCALGAFLGPELTGIGVFDQDDGDAAEFALLVVDTAKHGGIGTLLLEHLIAAARDQGIRRFTAEILSTNASMLQVMRDLGFSATRRVDHGETHVEFSLDVAQSVIAAISNRERSAGVASLVPLFAPRSVVVIGAGQRPGSVGHEVLRNLLTVGYTGAVRVVNPNRHEVLGVPCVPTVGELPDVPDLAVIALPAAQVADAVRACGERGVRVAVLLSAGFGEAGADGVRMQDEVLALARAHGMRLVGPNCLGVLNTDPTIRLDATFGKVFPRPGPLAVLSQSGAFGVALLVAADAAGLGVSNFVSVGNKIDVGGNDLLLAWDADPRTRVIAGYLESVGDPRRFARIARRVSRQTPILLVKSGRTEAGQAAGRSHTAAAASSDIAIDALLRGSGVIRLRTMRELLDAARVLCDQPLPAGPRVAIVGNSGGPEIMAADAVAEAGLVVAELDDATRAALSAQGIQGANPLDLGAAVSPETAAAALRTVLDSSAFDAVITVFTGIAITDANEMGRALGAATVGSDKPVVAVSVGEPPSTAELPATGPSSTEQPAGGAPATGRRLPQFTFPEEAAAALGVAHRYARLRERSVTLPIRPADVDVATARSIVDRAQQDGQQWLDTSDAFALLSAYGVTVCPHAVVTDAEGAADAATGLGYPLAAKIAAAGLHKTELGGVRLGLADEAALRAAVTDLSALGDGRVLLQPMVSGGTELIVGAVHDAQCGPLVMIGAGGVLTDVLGDRAFGLAPLTDDDADDLINSLRAARLLDGYRGAPVVDRAAVRDVLVRVAALVDDVPEIVELDLNPIIAGSDGLVAVDARARIGELVRHPDPLVRQLRGPRGTEYESKGAGHVE